VRRVRLVHLSDLHLGFRQYQRLTPAGVNQREADVARSFARAVDKTIALRPDLVVIAGDVFHTVRPSNPAILHAFKQFMRLRLALPDARIVMVAGNHDAPKTAETGCILRLFTECGVHVVDARRAAARLPRARPVVLAVPDVPGHQRPELEPDPARAGTTCCCCTARWPTCSARAARPADRAAVEIPRDELRAPEWDYVALGHYHVYREVAPNAYYSGSIDYTSFNAWGELREEREAGRAGQGDHRARPRHRRAHLPPARPLARAARAADAARAGMTPRSSTPPSAPRSTRCRAASTRRSCASSCATCRATSRASSTTRRCASTSAARCTSTSTRAAPRSCARVGERRPGAPPVARRHGARQAARAQLPPGRRPRALVALGLDYLAPTRWPPRRRGRRRAAAGGDGRRAEEARREARSGCAWSTSASTPTPRSPSAGLTGIIGPTARARRRCSRGSPGRSTASRPRAARATRSATARRPRAAVRVELEFELAGHRYRVVRGLTSAELYLDGGARRSPTRSPA
jgi:hypothetical protein